MCIHNCAEERKVQRNQIVQYGVSIQIDGTGYTVDPTRIDAICRIAMPTNVHETRSALGLFNWLSPFVPTYAP